MSTWRIRQEAPGIRVRREKAGWACWACNEVCWCLGEVGRFLRIIGQQCEEGQRKIGTMNKNKRRQEN